MTVATPMPASRAPRRPDVGIGWRHAHYAELLETQPALGFIEVHSENFFAPGGAALAVLREGRARYPVSLHGVGLSLGSAAGIDEWHLDQLVRLVHEIDPVRISDHASFARGVLPGALPGVTSPATVHAADLLGAVEIGVQVRDEPAPCRSRVGHAGQAAFVEQELEQVVPVRLLGVPQVVERALGHPGSFRDVRDANVSERESRVRLGGCAFGQQVHPDVEVVDSSLIPRPASHRPG